MRTKTIILPVLLLVSAILITAAVPLPRAQSPAPLPQTADSNPPLDIVKLIFIHHSTGENWLTDGYGNLGETLAENNYFVSDTNYGWGPNGIGDRTNIPDWLEWFRSDSTGTYFQALVNESGQHADNTRTLADPGGENQIILFKSCFPNSDLEGNPQDDPTPEGWLSVGHAKYVYNQILDFFKDHPDKLFIVITAPPLSDSTNASNARAFNQWLVNDWLLENDYPYHNVAVFDFYNVLTGTEGHHTFQVGAEYHQVANRDTLHYPSGDDHPSKKGSQKATEEFIPLLNYFYNRWQLDAPAAAPAESGESGERGQSPASPPELSGLLDNFEGDIPAGTTGWEAYWDESTHSSLQCGIESGAGLGGGGLRIDYQIAEYSWGTCGLFYDQPQDWSGSSGVAFFILADQGAETLDVDIFVEGPEGRESYVSQVGITDNMLAGWDQISLRWDQFQRVEWEADPGSPLTRSDQISGISFGFNAEENDIQGGLRIDDLGWLRDGDAVTVDQPVWESPTEEPELAGRHLPCIGSLAFPLGMISLGLLYRKRK